MNFKAKPKGVRSLPIPAPAKDFIDTLRPVRKPATCKGYANNLRAFHLWLAAQNASLRNITRSDMEKWLKSISDRQFDAMYRGLQIGNVRRYLEWLREKELIESDPHDLLRPSDFPKRPLCLPRPYLPENDRQLQNRFRDCGCIYCQALLLMRQTGVRVGELANLEYSCLEEDHLSNTFLKVPLGKLDNERLVPLNQESIGIVRKLQQHSAKDAQFLLTPNLRRETLILHLRIALRKAAQNLDIPGPIISHRLRHTYATELLNCGMSLIGIMKLLGHHSFRMTMRYAAITQETIVNEYKEALKKSEAQYSCPDKIRTAQIVSPNRMLLDAITWLRKHHSANPAQKRRSDAIIKRLHRIREDVAHL
jgi:site-specific recombinase XerD